MPRYRAKRLLDLVLVLATAPLWGMLLTILAPVVGWTIGRPILFGQERVGKGDRLFVMWKFRTMFDARGPDGQSLPDVVRLTNFGKWLRKWSLDEVPELLNVLSGDMSLVGPRPLLPQYLLRYSARHRRRHEVRPGVTGLAQVSGRNALTWKEKLDLDVEYIDHCSLLLDLDILAKTLGAVLRHRGVTAPTSPTMSEFMGYEPPPDPAPDEVRQ